MIAIAVPITSAISVAIIYIWSARRNSLQRVQKVSDERWRMKDQAGQRSTYCTLSHNIQRNIQPFWQESPTSLRQVQTTHSAQLDAKTLQENCEDICHQHNK